MLDSKTVPLSRRQFVRNSAIGLAAVGSMGLTAEALVLEPGSPVSEHIEVRLKRLPEAFDVSIPVQTQLIIELCSK